MNKPTRVIRGEQANVPLNVAVVGGGKAGFNLLELLDKDRSSRLMINIIAVSDVNPDSPGLQYAKEMGLFTTTEYHELYTLDNLNLIIELTGSKKIAEEIRLTEPESLPRGKPGPKPKEPGLDSSRSVGPRNDEHRT